MRLRFRFPLLAVLWSSRASAQRAERRKLRWGGDAEGGAPFVEADRSDPSRVRGMDVEIAGMIALGLGRGPYFVQVAWSSIEASLERGDFDVGMSGLEDSNELRARFAVSIPYSEFPTVLAVPPPPPPHYPPPKHPALHP